MKWSHGSPLRTSLTTLAWAVAMLAPGAPFEAQTQTDLEEQTTARLVVARVRIEPTRWANLGECRELSAADLAVRLRRDKIDVDGVDIDRRRRPALHALVIDSSGSMAGDLPYAQYAASEYVKQLRERNEKALVMSFDENVVLLQGVTGDKRRLSEAISRLTVGARTAMLDAAYYAMRELEAHRPRPVLVLLTDGADIASFYSIDDVDRLVAGRPDLTVFTIGVGLEQNDVKKNTKKLLRSLAQATDGEFFNVAQGTSLAKVFGTIRDILENEVVVTVVDPETARPPGQLSIRSKNANCKVRLLKGPVDPPDDDPSRRPIRRPFPEPPQAYSSQLTPGHQRLHAAAAERRVDPRCGAGGYFYRLYGGEPLEPLWFFHVGQRSISGCGLDVALEHGLLYDPAAEGLATHNDGIKMRARPFELRLPPMEQLPTHPRHVMDALAETAWAVRDDPFEIDPSKVPASAHARPFYDYATLAHGLTFMEMRPVLARAAFLYPRYREWALAKLRAAAEQELAELKESYRRRFPGLDEKVLQTAARHSQEAQRILARADQPSEIDLQQYLAAWLGDVQAYHLFRDWESDRIERLLRGAADGAERERFLASWWELRRVFFVPSYARTITLLAPVYDAGCDCVGYWRVVLPRTSWMKPRVRDSEVNRRFAAAHLDLIPDQPFGFWALAGALDGSPELAAHLVSGGFRVSSLEYALVGEPGDLGPSIAFDRARVALSLTAGGAGDVGSSPRLELAAEIALERGDALETGLPQAMPQVRLLARELNGVNDDRLARLAAAASSSSGAGVP